MNILDSFSNLFKQNQDKQRGFTDLINFNENVSSGFNNSFSNLGALGSYGTATSGMSLYASIDIKPEQLLEASREQVIYSAKDAIYKLLTKKGYGFTGGTNTSKLLKKTLEKYGYKEILPVLYEGLIGSGGGNVLLFVKKVDGDPKIICEPFYYDGKERVIVDTDETTKLINKYKLVNSSRQTILELDPSEVIHARYSTDGNRYFGTNPTIIASRYYFVKKAIMAMIESRSNKLSKDTVFASPETSFMIKVMEMNKDGSFFANWEVFKQSIEDQTGFVFSKIPLDFKKMYQSIDEGKYLETVKYLDEVMAGAFLASLSIQGRTEGVNYSNSEQNADNLNNITVEPIKIMIETITVDLLNLIVPNFDNCKNKFYFGKELDDEDLAQYQLKTQRAKTQAEILAILATNLNYTLDLETMEIVKIAEKSKLLTADSLISNENTELTQQPNETSRALKEIDYIKEFENSPEYLAVLNRIEKVYQDMANNNVKLETALNKQGWINLAEQLKEVIEKIYFEMYGEKASDDWILPFVTVSLFGYSEIAKYSGEIADRLKDTFPSDYEGMIAKIVDKGEYDLLTAAEKKVYIQNLSQNTIDGFGIGLLQGSFAISSLLQNRNYVGVNTMRDKRVRGQHLENDGKFWLRKTRKDFSRDYNCRCRYSYGSKAEMIKLGFTQF